MAKNRTGDPNLYINRTPGLESADKRIEFSVEKKLFERRMEKEVKAESRRLSKTPALTVGDLKYALEESNGNLTKAAELLAMDRAVLKRKIALYPSLQRLQENLKESVIDEAEDRLFEQVKEGYFPAVSLVLKTLGKERGYSERVTNEHELGPNANRTAAALIEAMRSGATFEPKQIESVTEEVTEPVTEVVEDVEWQVVEEDQKKS